jgi:hypothetical protein
MRGARATRLFQVLSLAAVALAPSTALAQPAASGEVQMTPPPETLPQAPGTPPAPPPPPPEVVTPVPPGAPPPEPNPPAGYIPGKGFIIQSPDAAYRLRIGLTAAYKFEPVYRGSAFQNRNTFFVLRPFIGGNFFKEWIHFWTSFEFASNPPYLLDSYVELAPWKELQFRIGQQWTPFDRHEYFGPQEILFPDWAPVSEYFWSGRDKGVLMLGTLVNQLDYYLGVFSGTPLRQFNAVPGNYMLQGRVTWNPMGATGGTEFPYITTEGGAPLRVSATLQGYYGKVQLAEQNFNPSTFRFETMATGDVRKQAAGGADLWLQGRCFMAFVDGFIRHTEPPMGAPSFTSVGVWGQAGVPLVDRTLDIGARFNWLDPSIDLSNDTFYSIEGQLAFYASHSQGLVVKLRYGAGHQDSPDMASLGAVPLVLASPGWAQLGTLQLNLAF